MGRTMFAMAMLVIVASLLIEGRHVCKEKDCSDIVGDGMVKDNLGHSGHYKDKQHNDWAEEARRHRVEIERLERHIPADQREGARSGDDLGDL